MMMDTSLVRQQDHSAQPCGLCLWLGLSLFPVFDCWGDNGVRVSEPLSAPPTIFHQLCSWLFSIVQVALLALVGWGWHVLFVLLFW